MSEINREEGGGAKGAREGKWDIHATAVYRVSQNRCDLNINDGRIDENGVRCFPRGNFVRGPLLVTADINHP